MGFYSLTKLLVTVQGIGGNTWIPKHIFEEIYGRKPNEQELLAFGAKITECRTCNTWTTHEHIGEYRVSNVVQNFQCTTCQNLKILIYDVGSGQADIFVRKYNADDKYFKVKELKRGHKLDLTTLIIPQLKSKVIIEDMASIMSDELNNGKSSHQPPA
jgi:hypothetical protein